MKAAPGIGLKLAQTAAVVAGVIGIAAVAAWSLPKVMAAGASVSERQTATRATVTGPHRPGEPTARPAILTDDPIKSHGKPLCHECGIIEALQRIETPLKFTGWCDATEIARTTNSGRAYGRDFRVDQEPLPDTVAAAIAASRSTTKEATTTRHRIIVRLRNGSRQVFEEAMPRTVNVGDRMVVIAGVSRASG